MSGRTLTPALSRREREIIPWRTGFGPGHEQFAVVRVHRAVVGELADARAGVPGRHATLFNNLGNHGGIAGHVVVRGERERGGCASVMASAAVLGKYGRDFSCVADIANGFGGSRRCDQAAVDGSFGDGDLFARKQRLDCVVKFGRCQARRCAAESDTVIDAAAVANFEIAIDQDSCCSAVDATRRNAAADDIFDERKRHVVLDGLRSDFENGIVGTGVHGYELHALVVELGVELFEARQITLYDRASCVRKYEDERALFDRVFVADKVVE